MPTEILMPALSPTMEEGTLAKWLVKEGDTVSSGDLLAEIETDKATMEFEAVDEGTIGKILVAEGTEGVKVNTPIARAAGRGRKRRRHRPAAAPPNPGRPRPRQRPTRARRRPPTAAPTRPPPATAAPKASDGTRIFASPLARRIAADKGLDLSHDQGLRPAWPDRQGRCRRCQRSDAKPAPQRTAASRRPPRPRRQHCRPARMPTRSCSMYEGRDFEEVTLDGMRKTIAARLTEAKQTIPHFYLRRDIQLDALLAFRAAAQQAARRPRA